MKDDAPGTNQATVTTVVLPENLTSRLNHSTAATGAAISLT
jgi:hypothetical protein